MFMPMIKRVLIPGRFQKKSAGITSAMIVSAANGTATGTGSNTATQAVTKSAILMRGEREDKRNLRAWQHFLAAGGSGGPSPSFLGNNP